MPSSCTFGCPCLTSLLEQVIRATPVEGSGKGSGAPEFFNCLVYPGKKENYPPKALIRSNAGPAAAVLQQSDPASRPASGPQVSPAQDFNMVTGFAVLPRLILNKPWIKDLSSMKNPSLTVCPSTPHSLGAFIRAPLQTAFCGFTCEKTLFPPSGLGLLSCIHSPSFSPSPWSR
jgi:hypothetical protein